MLYEIDGNFVDVVRESPYPDVLTIRASSTAALDKFTGMTVGDVLTVPHHIYQHILHVAKASLETKLHWKDLSNVEVLDRLTPEPAGFCYDYATEDEEGNLIGHYSYCWPHEIEEERNRLMHGEEPVAVEPTFIPVFYLPRELTGGPLPFDPNDDSLELNFGDD